MNLLSKRFGLVLAGVVGVGVIAALTIGASFALFNAQKSTPTHTFTAGTVALNNPAFGTCTPTTGALEPGDSGTCTFTVNYTGNLPAYIGAEATSSGALNPELTFTINGVTQTSSTPVVVGNSAGGKTSFTATVDYSFSSSADNNYQETQANVGVTFFAAQCSNNGMLASGVGDSGRNENCGDPGPASWSTTPTVSVSFAHSGPGSAAGWGTGDTSIVLTVPSSASDAGAYAVAILNNVGTSLPAAAPSFVTNFYDSGTPRWYIQLGTSGTNPYLFGYPSQYGNQWEVAGCTGTGNGTYSTYGLAVAAIAGCSNYVSNVTSVNIVADTSATNAYTANLTDVQYNGQSITAS